MKTILIALTLPFVSMAALAEPIALYVGCEQTNETCGPINFETGKTILITRWPAMIINSNDVVSGELRKGSDGEDEFLMILKPEKLSDLEKLADQNRGKRLAFVVGGRAIAAPVIQDTLRGGMFAFSAGAGNKDEYMDRLPWLKEMAEKHRASIDQKFVAAFSAAGIAVLFVGFSVYYFIRSRKKEA